MHLKTDNNSFLRFLKNERFIEWKLLPTDELNTYWEKYIQEHPNKKGDMLLANNHLQEISWSPFKMLPEKKQEVIHRLKHSLNTYKRKRRIRRFTYAAAAFAAILIISILYIQNEFNRSEMKPITTTDYIVGNELESEDILFITGNKTTSFQSNLDIQIRSDKTAQIKKEKEKEKDEEISIEQHTMNKLVVPFGKRSKIMLSDGTQVWLNSGSTLEFPSDFTSKIREIRLTGEMYIDVAHNKNKSFIVHTSDYNVKVYGTKFNLSTYIGESSSVVLVEGSVSLQSKGKQELFLSPNEQAVFSETTGTFDTQKVDVVPFTSWKDGYLTFEDTPVTEALKQIERYYNLSFNYGDDVSFQGLTCTGKIILSDNLDNVMIALTLISGTKYKKKDKLIYIFKE